MVRRWALRTLLLPCSRHHRKHGAEVQINLKIRRKSETKICEGWYCVLACLTLNISAISVVLSTQLLCLLAVLFSYSIFLIFLFSFFFSRSKPGFRQSLNNHQQHCNKILQLCYLDNFHTGCTITHHIMPLQETSQHISNISCPFQAFLLFLGWL